MDVATLKKLFLLSWCAETAYGKWHPLCPSLNQCAVTSLIVQDYFGGQLLRRKMTNLSQHFLNRLPNGTEIDLAEDQLRFIKAKPLQSETKVRSRSSLLRYIGVKRRYLLLKAKVEANANILLIPAD